MRIVPVEKRNVKPGHSFGRLSVVGEPFFLKSSGRWSKQWAVCVCECGVVICTRTSDLKLGKSSSCGCFTREQLNIATKLLVGTGGSGYKHGAACDGKRSRLHRIWTNMKQRCTNPKNTGWKHYGGRGITVTKDWCDFAVFQKWALSSGYRNDLSIDRINNDGNYEPENCRWATNRAQQRNKASNTFVYRDTEKMILKDYCDGGFSAADYLTTCNRISRGWSLEEALRRPKGKGRSKCAKQ